LLGATTNLWSVEEKYRMAAIIIHYEDRSKEHPVVGYVYALCGRYSPYLMSCLPREVTCKQCLKKMERIGVAD